MLLTLFLAVGFVLPWAISFGVNSESVPTRIWVYIFLAILLVIALVTIPQLMFFWFGIPILLLLFAWVFLGEPSGACVPKVPGDCE
jgi:hypothetical protein